MFYPSGRKIRDIRKTIRTRHIKYNKRRTRKVKIQKQRRVLKVPTHPIYQMNCSPAVKGKTVSETSCLTPKLLIDIKNKYNEDHPSDSILTKDPREIWFELHNRLLKEGCKKEDCWLKELGNSSLQKQIKEQVFAPDMPPEWTSNPDEWLSNFDIHNVLVQYEETYPDFKLMGPTTMDFDTKLPEKNNKCVEEEMCNFNLKQDTKKGFRKFACVINLDKYWQGGSHWVSLYVDIDTRIIFYFDSAGTSRTPSEIIHFVDRIKEQGKTLNQPVDFTFYTNGKLHHQTGNTECGMYSIFFVITMLTGKTPFYKERVMSIQERLDLFLKTRIPDEVIFDYRDLYFNKAK